MSKQVLTSDHATPRTTSSSGDGGRSPYIKVSGGNTGPQVTQDASSGGGGGALDELGFGSEKNGNLLSPPLIPAHPFSLRASVPPSPPNPVQNSAWRLRANALNQTGVEAHAPPKTSTGSRILIVDSLRQVEQHSVSFRQVEQQPVSLKKEGLSGYSDPENPEQMVKSPRPHSKSPRSKGSLLKTAGDQVIKDGSGAVKAAFSSVIGTIGFIGEGLRSAAVSFSFCSC